MSGSDPEGTSMRFGLAMAGWDKFGQMFATSYLVLLVENVHSLYMSYMLPSVVFCLQLFALLCRSTCQ